MLWEPTTCCCFSRRTGSLILGTVLLVFASFNLLGILRSVISNDIDPVIENVCAEEKEFENCNEITKKAVIGTYVTVFIMNTIQVIFSSMLIYGILKKKTCMQVPFMIMYLIHIILVTLIVLFILVLCAVLKLWLGVFLAMLFGGLYIFLETYFLLVIRAHYLEVRRAKAQIHTSLQEEGLRTGAPISEDQPIPYSALYPTQKTGVPYYVPEKANQY